MTAVLHNFHRQKFPKYLWKVGQAGKTHDSLSAYDYAQQKSNKETHKVAEVAMNKYKYGFCRLQQEYLNHNQY